MNAEIAKRIVLIRKANNLTQTEFAERLNTTRPKIAAYELNRVNFDSAFIDYICKVFNINNNWLIMGQGEMLNENIEAFVTGQSQKYGLSLNEEDTVKAFFHLPSEKRRKINKYVRALIDTAYNEHEEEKIDSQKLAELYDDIGGRE